MATGIKNEKLARVNSMALRANRVTLQAYAKLNLTLEVLFRRDDGFHELRTVMHSVGIYDTLTISRSGSHGVNVRCGVPLPERNTANTAAELYMAHTGCGGVDIEIVKGIPSEAGLGGASADAAGVLYAMELLYGGIGEDALYDIARRVGADVPFCLKGGCALAEGIGERLTALAPIDLPLLVVKGERGVSTGRLFDSLRLPTGGAYSCGMYSGGAYSCGRHSGAACLGGARLGETGSRAAISAIVSGDANMLASNLMNALMPAAEDFAPEISEYRARMIKCGALGACMTGSGSAVFGIFASEAEAISAAGRFDDCVFRAVCRTRSTPFELLSLK